MATIEIKFECGDRVEHFTGICGMITAIFHRANKNSYEMVYLVDGKPTCVAVDECELSEVNQQGMGFTKK